MNMNDNHECDFNCITCEEDCEFRGMTEKDIADYVKDAEEQMVEESDGYYYFNYDEDGNEIMHCANGEF